MKKSLMIFFLCLGLLFSLNANAFATTTNTNVSKDAKEVLTKYLEAVSNQNVDEMLKYVDDKRYSSNDSAFQKTEYTQFLEDQKLISYEIRNTSKVSENQMNFLTVLKFDTGGIEQVPFSLKFNKLWKIVVDTNSLDKSYQIIQKGAEKAASNAITPLTTTLASWNFSNRADGSTFYSNATFNISGSTANLGSLLQETNNSYYLGGITYSIVKKIWYGDTVWGSKNIPGWVLVPGNYSISGSGTITGAQIRFQTDLINTDGVYYQGSGSLTQ